MPLPTKPVPATWPLRATGHVYAADMNTQVRDAVKFLNRQPMFFGTQTASSQSIASGGADVNVILDTSLIDNYQAMNDANQKQWTVPAGCDGLYVAIGCVSYNSAALNQFGCDIAVNGASPLGGRVPSTTGANATSSTIDLLKVSAGDNITLQAVNNTVGAVNLFNGTVRFPYLYLQRVSNSTGTASLTPPTALHTWATNDQTHAAGSSSAGNASFLAEIQKPLQFLAFPPYLRAQTSGAQAGIVTAVNTQITGLSATGFDNYSAFSANTWTCPVSGVYLVGAQISWSNANPASYVTRVQCVLSAVTTVYEMGAVAGQTNVSLAGYRFIRFTAGDTMILQGRQNSGGNLSTTGGTGDTRLIAVWWGA